MTQAANGDTVRVHYTGKLSDGTVFDTSRNRHPLEFTLGQSEVIAGFEKAVLGLSPGETVSVTVSPEEGYGPHRPGLVIEVEEGRFPTETKPEVGQEWMMRQTDGGNINVRITKIEGGNVTLDANHPLAGEDLHFDIELVEIVTPS